MANIIENDQQPETTGNMGESNLSRLQMLKDRLLKEHQVTLVERMAKKIDRSYDAFLVNGPLTEYSEIYQILMAQIHSPHDVTNPEYFLRCAIEVINQGLYMEDEEGRILFLEGNRE
jgi:hypothetical protein